MTVDADLPVPDWSLSPIGVQRTEALCRNAELKRVETIYSSTEKKALDTADIISQTLARPHFTHDGLCENDRSSTGFLVPDEFQRTADLFFAHPAVSIRGWERAIDAQHRIYSAVSEILENDRSEGDIAIVAHGGVGALLLCKLSQVDISRKFDQPGEGGGNFFKFGYPGFDLTQSWTPIA